MTANATSRRSGEHRLHLRPSLRPAGETNTSKDGMAANCRALADEHCLDVVAVHIDNGGSGAIGDRLEFVAWLDGVRELRAGSLIASHADRLTREGISAAAMILDAIKGKARDPELCKTKTVRQPARLPTANNRLDSLDDESFRRQFIIAAEVARPEWNRTVARTTTACQRIEVEERWAHGQPALGIRSGHLRL